MIEQRRPPGGDPGRRRAHRVDRRDRPAPTVVDVGGGSGTRAVPLAVHGRRGDGGRLVGGRAGDPAPPGRGRRGRRPGQRRAGRRRVAGVGHPAGGADLVLCHHLLEEVDDPAAVVAALAAAVRPGGQVSVLVAGRLGAVVGQTLAGRFARGRRDAGRSRRQVRTRRPVASAVRRRRHRGLLTAAGLHVDIGDAVSACCPGLVSGAARQAVPVATASWPAWRPLPPSIRRCGRSPPICTSSASAAGDPGGADGPPG